MAIQRVQVLFLVPVAVYLAVFGRTDACSVADRRTQMLNRGNDVILKCIKIDGTELKVSTPELRGNLSALLQFLEWPRFRSSVALASPTSLQTLT